MAQTIESSALLAASAAPRPDSAHHVCLAGAGVSNNWSLIEPLKRGNQVTVIENLGLLYSNSILATASVLVLDCGDHPDAGIGAVRGLKTIYPDLRVVLVNGGMAPNEIAEAFREGATDYFSHHSNPDLVLERIEHLCRQVKRAEAS